MGNQTFYANQAYISLETIYATNECGQVGKGHAGTVVPIASSDIYSVGFGCQDDCCGVLPTQFNFADLSSVPAVAWNERKGCSGGAPNDVISSLFGGFPPEFRTAFDLDGLKYTAWLNGEQVDECDVILDAGYAPALAVPPQIRAIDPAWATCLLDLQGLYDPPKVLTMTSSAAGVTVPAVVSATPASGPSSVARRTSTPAAPASTTARVPAESAQAPSSTADAQSSSPQQQGATTSTPYTAEGSTSQDAASPIPNPNVRILRAVTLGGRETRSPWRSLTSALRHLALSASVALSHPRECV